MRDLVWNLFSHENAMSDVTLLEKNVSCVETMEGCFHSLKRINFIYVKSFLCGNKFNCFNSYRAKI